MDMNNQFMRGGNSSSHIVLEGHKGIAPMSSRERVRSVLSHKEADKIAVDFGSTAVTGIHCSVVEKLRRHYGLDEHPVFVNEPFQMLGYIEQDLAEVIGTDCVGAYGEANMFGVKADKWKEVRMPWGQVVMLPEKMALEEKDGRLYTYPEGDTSVAPSAVMPESGFFFDAIDRSVGEVDDEKLKLEDNLEEFVVYKSHDIDYWERTVENAASSGRAVVANIGGMGLGDIALVPGMQLKHPKGIRGVAEWYMSTVMRADFVKEIFDRQTDIAIINLEKINDAVGNLIDVVNICGADFGTQNGQFCSDETFRDLYLPYYKKVNDWIHEHTEWKTFKHSCGAVRPLIDAFVDAGFDILNPVQINASGMEPEALKRDFGNRVTFWGGGVDTQNEFAHGAPQQVADQVRRLCDIFGRDGGFVFNTIHNIQANVPFENVVAMIETLKEIRNV